MKKTFILALAAICINSLRAQENAQESKENHLKEILDEKLRWPLNELEAYYYTQKKTDSVAEKHLSKTLLQTNETKISQKTAVSIDEGEAFIAINPTDSNNLVLAYIERGPVSNLTFPIYYSTDGGTSWTKSNFNPTTVFVNDFADQIIGGGGDPVLAFDRNGKLYFSWIYVGVDFPNDLASVTLNWAYSLDGGVNFQLEPDSNHFIGVGQFENLRSGTLTISNEGDGIFDRQWMSTDLSNGPNSNRLYVSCLFVPNNSTELKGTGTIVRIKEGGNTSFKRKNYILSSHRNTQFGNVVVDNQGTAHVTYIDLSSNQLMYARLSKSDTSFSVPVAIQSTTNLFPTTAPFHYRSNGAPNLVADQQNNTLYLVYSDFKPSGKVSSYFKRSIDGGNTWSAIQDISAFTTGHTSLMPTVTAANGRVSLSWYDIDSNQNALHYTVQSLDQGNNWLTPVTLSADTTKFKGGIYNKWFGDYNNSVRTNCYTYSVYADGRDGRSTKMYVSRINNCKNISIADVSPLTTDISLKALFPNPVNNLLNLSISSLQSTSIALSLRTVSGQEAAFLYRGQLSPGDNSLKIKIPRKIQSGVYTLFIQTDLNYFHRRLVIQ